MVEFKTPVIEQNHLVDKLQLRYTIFIIGREAYAALIHVAPSKSGG
jgi:hypothetical protein